MTCARVVSRATLAVAMLAALCFGTAAAFAGNYSVINTNDSGTGSLREAITLANEDSSPSLIYFNLPEPPPYAIEPLSPLPFITNTVTIDARSQTSYAGRPVVELDGTFAGAGADALHFLSDSNAVRGLVINRFGGTGIVFESGSNNVAECNFIGTDTNGLAVLGNGTGIRLLSPGNRIGGTSAAFANVIAGNLGNGIEIESDGNTIQGNFIGTDLGATNQLGNGGAGVSLGNGSGNMVGGSVYGSANTVAYNAGAGVSALAGTNNLVRGNPIFQNGGRAIDWNSGNANANQAVPTLGNITPDGTGFVLAGSLDSKANTAYQIDFYNSPGCGISGAGEARSYLGSTTVTTGAGGLATYSISFPGGLPVGSYLTATATDPDNNTSELSPCELFSPPATVDLAVSSAASTNHVLSGLQVQMTVTVSNNGTNTATGVILTNLLPAGLEYVYIVPSQGSVVTNAGVASALLGNLAPGSQASLLIFAHAPVDGVFTNTASVTADQYNTNLAARSSGLVVTAYSPSPPVFQTQPLGVTINLGGLLQLSVNVIGSGSLRYQWRHNGANVPGATNSVLQINSALLGDAGNYTCMASDEYGVTISGEAAVGLLNLGALFATDDFATFRLPLASLGLPLSFSNVGKTSEPSEPPHAGVPGGHSAWFTWTPLLSGIATISTEGSGFDTLLAVYTGNKLTNLTEVVSDDDSAGYYVSKVVFNAVGGTTYQIAIDGAYGATGLIYISASEQITSQKVPVITAQPAGRIVGLGSNTTFAVSATGSSLSYQWYFNGAAISGATSSSLTVTNVDATRVGLYNVKVTTGSKSLFSAPATLQIGVLDGIVNSTGGSRDKFQTTTLGGGPGLFRAGLKGGAQKNSGGGSSRGYSSTQIFNTYGGNTQSGEPNLCNDPGGASAWTSVEAIDTGIMTMNTAGSNFKTILGVFTGNGNDFSSLTTVACDTSTGTNGSSKVVFAAINGATYYVAVDGINGAYGTVMLNWTLSVPPTIADQPLSQTNHTGASVTFNSSATGTFLKYQWLKNGAAMSGATNTMLNLQNITAANAGLYSMVASNISGSVTSNPAMLAVIDPPGITGNPQSATNNAGTTISLTVGAGGQGPLNYCWIKNNTNTVSGATNSTLMIANALGANAGSYKAVVGNAGGSVTSSVAVVTVIDPVINTQPSSLSLNAGQTAHFTVAAAGTSLSYQWQKANQNIAGATGASYDIPTVGSGDAAQYLVIATSAYGSVTSSVVALSVLNPPMITGQPQSQTNHTGANVTFTTLVSGSSLSFQWLKNSMVIPGATSTNMMLTNIGSSDVASYTMVVSNAAGTVTSAVATLTIIDPPVIDGNPQSMTNNAGTIVNLAVAATGQGPLTYLWLKNVTNILSGQTTNTLQLSNVLGADSGSYQAVVGNVAGSVTSAVAVVTVIDPVINSQPLSLSLNAGQTAHFSISATGSALTYQWQKNNSNIGNATGTGLDLANITSADEASYSVVVTSTYGSVTSSVVTLSVLNPPMITGQPQSLTNHTGANVSFTTQVGGSALSFQWFKNAVAISGATSTNLTLTNIGSGDVASYTMVVSNAAGAVTSSPATLTIIDPPVVSGNPQSVTNNAGTTVNLTVAATGQGPFTYLWLMNATNVLTGQATNTLALANILGADAGSYQVVVGNVAGSVTSVVAVVTVIDPVINSQPSSLSLNAGQTAHFAVGAAGSALTYQWQRNSSSIGGATAASLDFTNVTSADESTYRVIVSSTYGSVTSAVVTLSVLNPPMITGQPQNQTNHTGANVSFTTLVSGTSLNFQWFRNGTAISGATGTNLMIMNISSGDVASYTMVVSNAAGAVTSSPAMLTIIDPPVISGNPQGVTNNAGATVNLSVAATGQGPLTYLWLKNSTNVLSGQTTNMVVLANVLGADAGSYQAVAANSAGSVTSTVAVVTIIDPVINSQPSSVSLNAGQMAHFAVSATGSALTYQWQKNSQSVGGATGENLDIANISETDAGQYRVIVSSTFGSVTSAVATLTVSSPPGILSQPASQTVAPGGSVTLQAGLSGFPAPACQWFKDGAVLAGETNATLSISNFQAASEASYQLKATNALGSVTSTAATLLLNTLRIDQFAFNPGLQHYQMRVIGVTNTTYVVQASANCVDWAPLATNASASGFWQFTDNDSTNKPGRLYRAVGTAY